MTHTQGKLAATVFDEGFFSIEDDSGDPIGEVYGGANAFRIVACWNTCDGISTEHLEGGIAGVLTRVRKGVRMAEHGLGMGRSMTTPQTAATLAYIAAAQARIEGMKAKNIDRQAGGYALAYDDNAFFAESDQLERLAQDCINQPLEGV